MGKIKYEEFIAQAGVIRDSQYMYYILYVFEYAANAIEKSTNPIDAVDTL